MKLCEPKRKCLKAIPTHLQNHVMWSQTLKCNVKPHVTGASTKCYFNECLFMPVFTHDKIDQINSCEHSECHGLPVLYSVYLQEVVFKNNPSDHETWSIPWHVERNPCRPYIHLTFTYSDGPSSVVWSSELGPAPPFPPMGVLEVYWSRALSLVCEVAPRAHLLRYLNSLFPCDCICWPHSKPHDHEMHCIKQTLSNDMIAFLSSAMWLNFPASSTSGKGLEIAVPAAANQKRPTWPSF